MGGASVGAGMVQAPQVQLQTPRDEEEEEHGRSQVSGRADCGPRALMSRWRRSGKCRSRSAFVLTGLGAGPAWAVLREVVRRTPRVAGRGLETWYFCPGFDRCLLSASCSPPHAGIVCKASSSYSTLLFAERLSWYAAPTTGNLGFRAFVGNTVSLLKSRTLQPRGNLIEDFVLSGRSAQPYFYLL